MASPYALDFSPLTQAIQNNQQNEFTRNRLAMEQERLGFEREMQPLALKSRQLDVAQREAMNPLDLQAKQQGIDTGQIDLERGLMQHFGGLGQAMLTDPDASKKQGYLDTIKADPRYRRMLDKHLPPGWDGNPDLVGHFMTAVAKGYVDPLKAQAAQQGVDKGQFELGEARANAPTERQLLAEKLRKAKESEPVDDFIRSLLPGGGRPAAPPAPQGQPGQPSVPPGAYRSQPQSNVAPQSPTTPGAATIGMQGGAPADSGGLILAQDARPGAAPPVPQPSATPAPQSAQEVLAGRSEAERLGFALTLKKDPAKAGQMLQDWANPNQIAKPTHHDLDKAEIGFTNMMGAFTEIQRLYDPKFLKAGSKISYALNNFRDKWTPDTWKNMNLTPDESAELGRFEKFGATAMNNLNTRLKELSGTAVTETEMVRILRELPSPGTGPLSGDGPTAFKAKLEQGMRLTKMGIARTRYLRATGFAGDVNKMAATVPLDDMPRLIDRRGAEILQKMREDNPGVPDQQLMPAALHQTAKEFGI